MFPRSTWAALGAALFFAFLCVALTITLIAERSRDNVRLTLTDKQVYGYDLGPTAKALQRLTGTEATVTPLGRNHWRFQLEPRR